MEAKERKRLNQQTYLWVIVLIILIIVILYKHIFHLRQAKQQPPVPVETAQVRKADVPIYLNELGSVSAVYTVTVRTQIAGQLLQVFYKEGQNVKKGDLLAQIDPRTYQAQLVQYQGQLLRDQALLANALIDLKRYQTLWSQNSISQQTLATQQSLVRQYEGDIRFDQGQIETVKVNLIYTRITSPIDGRVGLRLVDPGNFVQPSDTGGLLVINTINPIQVIFTIAEDNIPDVIEQLNQNKQLIVNAYDRTQNRLLGVGKLISLDNQIDTTTGTLKLKASFNNDKNLLFPNQFVNIALLVKTLHNAIVIPTAAVQRGPQGNLVYVLNADNTVNVKSVQLGPASGNDTVVQSGVVPGEMIVTLGTDKLTQGSKVVVANARE